MKVVVILFLLLLFKTSYTQTVAPDFTLTDVTGVTRNLYNELDSGKTVVLDFFSTSCGTCISNIPILENFWQINGNNGDSLWVWGIEINGITDSALLAFHNQYPSTFPSYSTYIEDTVVLLYNITYSPQYWVVCPSHFMKFVSVSNVSQAVIGCRESTSVKENNLFQNENWFSFESNNVHLILSESSFPGTFKVYNLFGKSVLESEIFKNMQNINFNNLPSGVYIISFLSIDGIVLNGKILIY